MRGERERSEVLVFARMSRYERLDGVDFMKTYESERRELFEWRLKESSEYFKALKKDREKGIFSKDSERNMKMHEIDMEYNRKLLELKRKYNVE